MGEDGWSYREAGVDLDAAERAKERLKALVADTNRILAIGALVLTTAAVLWLWRRSRRRRG